MEDNIETNQQRAFREISEEFNAAPKRVVIPVPEINNCCIFGNLSIGAVLTEVAADKDGRLWMHDREKGALVMIFDPRAIVRTAADAPTTL